MVLDLGKVSHLNSIAIGILVGAHTNYQKRGGRIVLCNVDRRIENVFVVIDDQDPSHVSPNHFIGIG